MISTRDANLLNATHVKPMTWEESLEVARIGDLTLFRRSPQQIQDYLEAKVYFQRVAGDTASFILENKLHWKDEIAGKGGFLENKSDVKILPNDFPYFFVDGIHHLVVWSKVRCECSPDEQPTPASAEKINQFLQKTLEPLGIKRENYMWFKNTVSLQSVPTLEHFHVLVRQPGFESLLGTAGCLESTAE